MSTSDRPMRCCTVAIDALLCSGVAWRQRSPVSGSSKPARKLQGVSRDELLLTAARFKLCELARNRHHHATATHPHPSIHPSIQSVNPVDRLARLCHARTKCNTLLNASQHHRRTPPGYRICQPELIAQALAIARQPIEPVQDSQS